MSVRQRRRARQLALQALYQHQLNDMGAGQLRQQFMEDVDQRADRAYMLSLLDGVLGDTGALDAACTPHLSRPLAQLDPISLNILRIGILELVRGDVPPRVALSEAVELAKVFGPDGSDRLVNAVLDKVAHS